MRYIGLIIIACTVSFQVLEAEDAQSGNYVVFNVLAPFCELGFDDAMDDLNIVKDSWDKCVEAGAANKN